MSNKVVFSLLVDNEAGVLSRVAGLFSRRGYNIDSLTVGETQDKRHSRMTVVAEGEPEVLEQIEKQLAKPYQGSITYKCFNKTVARAAHGFIFVRFRYASCRVAAAVYYKKLIIAIYNKKAHSL